MGAVGSRGQVAEMGTDEVWVRSGDSWVLVEVRQARSGRRGGTLGKERPWVSLLTSHLLLGLVLSQLLKLGTGLLESGRQYLASSRAFIAGICDLARLGPPEPMMAVCGRAVPREEKETGMSSRHPV